MGDLIKIIYLYHSNMRKLNIHQFKNLKSNNCVEFFKNVYSLPWDQSTIYGYFGELIYGILSSLAFSTVNGVILVFFISMCWNHRAFYERFQHSIHKIDSSCENRNDNVILCDLIRFQNATKR